MKPARVIVHRDIKPANDSGPVIRVELAEHEQPGTEADVDAWLRSLLETPGNPDDGRRQ